jgi:hypothetical protein
MGGGNNKWMTIGMAALGAFAPAAMGAWGTSGASPFLTEGAKGVFSAGEGAGFFGNMAAQFANTSWFTTALSFGGLGMALGATEPTLPDYSGGFGAQKELLDLQGSFRFKNNDELEELLLNGSQYEKNQAFNQLQLNGADTSYLQEIATRKDRTTADQARLDQFIETNAPPSAQDLALLGVRLGDERVDAFDQDVGKEIVRIKQIMAKRGTLDSNINRELNLRLTEISARNRIDIRSAAIGTVNKQQQDIQNIAGTQYNRLLSGATNAQQNRQYDLSLAALERDRNLAFVNASQGDYRNASFAELQNDIASRNLQYQLAYQRSNQDAMMGYGAAGYALSQGFNSATPAALQPDFKDRLSLLNQTPINSIEV